MEKPIIKETNNLQNEKVERAEAKQSKRKTSSSFVKLESDIDKDKKYKIEETKAKQTESSSQKPVTDSNKLIVIIRISGMVKVPKDIENALYRLKLRRKYSCVVVKPSKDILGMIEKVKYYVAYGEINKEIYDKLVNARGKKVDGKLKPFFRLHPPRGGIKSKLQYPKGVLGDNKEDINKLVGRML